MRTIKIIALFIACTFFAAGFVSAQEKISGKGPKVTKQLSLDQFHSIGVGVNATVHITKGSQSVSIDGQENIINNIKTEVKDGSWSISFDKKAGSYEGLTINISMPTVKNLSIGGSAKIISEDAFTGLDELNMSIGGSGDIEFSGSANKVVISIAGSGSVKASELKAGNCEVSIAGSGDAYIDVNTALDVSIAGSGDVRYKGSPKVSSSIAGSGNVRSVNE